MSQRTFDIVVMGATGYSGRLVARELNRMGAAYRWAIAGRDAAKLDALKAELGLTVPVLVADGKKAESLDALCKQTAAVIGCAGPFDLVGCELVASCVRNKTHYCDINGEVQFMRRMVEQHHEAAKAAGVAIVLSCGYDCVPSEVGNFVTHKLACETGKAPLDSVHAYFRAAGSPSGGTMATVANLYDTMTAADKKLNSLTPKDAPKAKVGLTTWVSRNTILGGYSGPYIMASINERLVRRSNGLEAVGASYQESTEGPLMHVLAGLVAVYMMAFLLPIRPIRNFLRHYVFPTPGTGPSEEELARGRFKGTFIGENSAGAKVMVEVSDKRHGYTFTGLSAAISGILLAEQAATEEGARVTGVITPSVAFGQDLVDRLRAQGVVIKAL